MLTKIKEWIIKTIIQRKVTQMLDGLKAKLEGKKTYITAGLGVLVALVGVLFGPVNLPGNLTIPEYTWNEFFSMLWASGLCTFLHMKK